MLIVTPAVYRGFISQLAPLHLTFRHRAGVSPYTSAYALAETCVFSKQSDGPFLCGPHQLAARGRSPSRAPLLPKLRGNFAEFLSHVSLDRLRILFSPTCVGLRYGHLIHMVRAFLGSMESISSTLCVLALASELVPETFISDPLRSCNGVNHHPADLSYPVLRPDSISVVLEC